MNIEKRHENSVSNYYYGQSKTVEEHTKGKIQEHIDDAM